MFKGHGKREGNKKHTSWVNGFVICCWDFLGRHFCEIQYVREDHMGEGWDGLDTSAKAVEMLWIYSLEHLLFTLTADQRACVVGKHPNTWESTCPSVCTAIWYSSKWLSRSPGMLVQPACTLQCWNTGRSGVCFVFL